MYSAWLGLIWWDYFCPVAAYMAPAPAAHICVWVETLQSPFSQTCWPQSTHLTAAMVTIQTRCLCLCHTGLGGLSSDGTVQPRAIKQLFPVHQMRLVTLDENISAWFPWLQRGEKWLASQPAGPPFIHTHIIYFCRILEGLRCTHSRTALKGIVRGFTSEHFSIPSLAAALWLSGS